MKLLLLLGLAGPSYCCFQNSRESKGGACRGLKAKPFIKVAKSKFGSLIEGTSVNPKGDIFAVNYGNSDITNQLGQIYPKQQLIFKDKRPKSFLNSIRFVNSTTAFAADVTGHRILKLNVDPKTNKVVKSTIFCSHKDMIQPNDLVVASTGYIFASGMRYAAENTRRDGDIWSCSPKGEAKRLARLGRSNGIELSPSEDFLYVSEALNRGGTPYLQKVWKFNANVNSGKITNPVKFIDFGKLDNSASFDIDGIRADIYGNLFIARSGKGIVQVFNKHAKSIATIHTSFPKPTNLEFGGPKGSTLFIVGQCPEFSDYGKGMGCVDTIELETQGAGYKRISNSKPWRKPALKRKPVPRREPAPRRQRRVSSY